MTVQDFSKAHASCQTRDKSAETATIKRSDDALINVRLRVIELEERYVHELSLKWKCIPWIKDLVILRFINRQSDALLTIEGILGSTIHSHITRVLRQKNLNDTHSYWSSICRYPTGHVCNPGTHGVLPTWRTSNVISSLHVYLSRGYRVTTARSAFFRTVWTSWENEKILCLNSRRLYKECGQTCSRVVNNDEEWNVKSAYLTRPDEVVYNFFICRPVSLKVQYLI